MLSDGRLVDHPLAKKSCLSCGNAQHVAPPHAAELAALFGPGYTLYAHSPGRPDERRRQQAYAHWIGSVVGDQVPTRVFEAGCGNGSLLIELAALWQQAEFLGVEPSSAAVAFAKQAGVIASCGFVEDLPPGTTRAELAISVNVIEHALDPEKFLRALKGQLSAAGRAIVVCPNGNEPSTELLFFDHIHSFTTRGMSHTAARAGLAVTCQVDAPAAVGSFRLYVLTPGHPTRSDDQRSIQPLAAVRQDYLGRWASLDRTLLERIGSRTKVVCFGVGETALLLRAYAPLTWATIEEFTADDPIEPEFDGRPVVRLDKLIDDAASRSVLVAVRPRDQASVARRLRTRAPNVITWDDLIAA